MAIRRETDSPKKKKTSENTQGKKSTLLRWGRKGRKNTTGRGESRPPLCPHTFKQSRQGRERERKVRKISVKMSVRTIRTC